MLITCLQHVDYLSTACWLPVYNMLISFLQHVDYLSTTCWLPFCNMFIISVCIRNSSLTGLYHLGKHYLFCSNISRIPVMIQIYRVPLVTLLIATFIFWYFFYTFSHYNAHIIWTFVNIRPNVDLKIRITHHQYLIADYRCIEISFKWQTYMWTVSIVYEHWPETREFIISTVELRNWWIRLSCYYNRV